MSSPPKPDQRRQGYILSGDESLGSGDGMWRSAHSNYNYFQYASSSTSVLDPSLNYGGNDYGPSASIDPEVAFDQMINNGLPSLDYDLPNSLLNLDGVPTINVNRSNTLSPDCAQNWQSHVPVYLSPIQTDIPMHTSPTFSILSQTPESSQGFLSPHQTDPMTPSTTSSHEAYAVVMSPGSSTRRLDSQSPATSYLGLTLEKMNVQLDNSPLSSGPSSGRSSFVLPSSASSSSTSENFTFGAGLAWSGMQMTSNQGRPVSISGGANRPQPQDHSSPSSAPSASTMTLASPQIRPSLSHAEQYQSWKDTPAICPVAGNLKLFVPQRMYKPHTGSDRRRYVEEVRLSPPIIFEVEHPPEWGIALDDALKCRTKGLVNKDALMFEGCGPSVSIRLEWPGVPWSRQIPTKDFRSPPGPITKEKLAKNIAKCIQRFIKDTQGKPINDEDDANALRFKVGTGPDDVKLEDLILVSLHHVSQGSWQPHLRLRRQI